MPRKRIDLGPKGDDRIVEGMIRGESAETIAGKLSTRGQTVSARTVQRRMTELRGRANAQRAEKRAKGTPAAKKATPAAVVEEVDEAVEAPAGLALEEYDRLIVHYEQLSRAALDEGDDASAQGWARVALQYRVERRKAEPPARVDPNENPDFVKLKTEVRERLHKAVTVVTELRDGR